jgi:hypothetical protein
MIDRHTTAIGLASAVLMLAGTALAGCANGDTGSAGDPEVSIEQPAAGATVTAPFTVTVKTSSPLGSESSGNNHVHVYFDDKRNDYVIGETEQVTIPQAPPGTHLLHVSLRHANHSPVGPEAQVSVTVSGAGGTTGGPSAPAPADDDSTGPYGY